jgi:hypothetical protein
VASAVLLLVHLIKIEYLGKTEAAIARPGRIDEGIHKPGARRWCCKGLSSLGEYDTFHG